MKMTSEAGGRGDEHCCL